MTPVFIMGVWKRCGTNFLANLLRLHPSFQLPRPLWEDALLHRYHLLEKYVDGLMASWRTWVRQDNANADRIRGDLVRCLGSGLLEFMHSRIDPGARLLCKTPQTTDLNNFFSLFPQAKLIILVRDGRDVVESAKRSWPKHSYRFYMKQWAGGARRILTFINGPDRVKADQWLLVKYEDLVSGAHDTLTNVVRFASIDEREFPWGKVDELGVVGSSVNRGETDELHWTPIRKGPDFQPLGRWQPWGFWRKFLFKRIAGRELIELGYAEGHHW